MLPPRPLACLLLVALCGVLAGCRGIDGEQLRICQSLLEAFEPDRAQLRLLGPAEQADGPGTVLLRFRSPDTAEHWIACRFAATAADDPARYTLTAVATDGRGVLTGIQLEMLHIWLRLREQGLKDPTSAWRRGQTLPATTAGPPASGWARPLLYALQQAVNAIVPSCVLGLLAIAYTLCYGVLGRLNLALGEVYMIGAFLTVIGVMLLTPAGLDATTGGLLAVLLGSAVLSAVPSLAMGRWVLTALPARSGQAPLIAAIGLSIALQETVRQLQGAKDRWLPPRLQDSLILAEAGGFPVHLLLSQGLILLTTLLVYALLLRLLATSDYGRAYRACVDDAGTAALMGIDVRRTTAATFALAGAVAAVGGFFVATYYGGVNFFMGFLVGFKALTAAVVGGIGVVPGAMLGGVVVGLLETLWSAYLTVAYKDIAVFGLLALFLIFRPHGLLGQPTGRGD